MQKHISISLILILVSFISFAQRDTITTPSGLQYIYIEKRGGAHAKEGYEHQLNVRGTLENGKEFWNSKDSGTTFDVVLGKDKLIKGFEECLSLMQVGDEVLAIIPYQLGYGEKGYGELIPPRATLYFEIKLLGIAKPRESVIDSLFNCFCQHGTKEMAKLFKSLKKQNAIYDMREKEINKLGQMFLEEKMSDAALLIFETNVKDYPDSWRALNNLGKAYLKLNESSKAFKAFKKSYKINPKEKSTLQYLQQLMNK